MRSDYVVEFEYFYLASMNVLASPGKALVAAVVAHQTVILACAAVLVATSFVPAGRQVILWTLSVAYNWCLDNLFVGVYGLAEAFSLPTGELGWDSVAMAASSVAVVAACLAGTLEFGRSFIAKWLVSTVFSDARGSTKGLLVSELQRQFPQQTRRSNTPHR